MGALVGLFALASTIWMTVDATRIGYDKRDIDGLGAMGPVGWCLCGLFFWYITLPLYLYKRPALIAAAQQRRLQLQGAMGVLPGQVPGGYSPGGYGVPPQPGYGAPPQAGYGAPPQAGFGAPPQAGFGAPPQAGYGAPPQAGFGAPPQAGYGAPPQPQAGYAGQPPAHAAQPQAGYGGQPQTGYSAQPAPPQPSPPAPYPQRQAAQGAGAASRPDVVEEIVKLGALRDQGLLTDAEFQAKKTALLNRR